MVLQNPRYQLIGGPDWLHKKVCDIAAKCDRPVGGKPWTMNRERRETYVQQLLLRLQSLLADRFQLKLRPESREMHVYELVTGSKGPKFEESPRPGPDGKIKQGSILRPGHVEAYHAPMDIIARILSQVSGLKPVRRPACRQDWRPHKNPSLRCSTE